MRSSLIFVAATVALAACTTTDTKSGSDAQAGGTLILALAAEPQDLFPPLVGDASGRLVQDQVFDRLAEIKPELASIGDKPFSPRLAESWTWAPDSLSIAFKIHPQARWHDGKPVRASDVRYSFRMFTDPKVGSPNAPLFANIDSVSVRDSATAVVWFKRHTPEQFYDVAYQLIIVPEHVYGSVPVEQLRTSPVMRSPVGSGRFRFNKWEPGVRLELVADTANFRGRPKLDRVIITAPDPTVSPAMILSGDADFMENFPTARIPQLDTSKVAGPIPWPNFGYVYVAMNRYDPDSPNAPHPIFSDSRVRRALQLGADRQAMLQNVFGTSGRIGRGPFSMTVAYGDSTLRLPPFDTVAAKALLDSAGWVAGPGGQRAKNGRPLRFSLSLPSVSHQRRAYAVLLQEQYRKLGARVDVEIQDPATFFSSVPKGEFDAALAGFNSDVAVSGMKQTWATSGIGYVNGKGVTGQNTLRYSNPRVDALIDSATMAFDPAMVKSYASRASQIIIDDAPAVFLYDMVLIHALHRRVTPVNMRADEWWADLAEWTIAPGKRIERDGIGLAPAPKP